VVNKNISQTLSEMPHRHQAFVVLSSDILHDDQRYGGKVAFSSIYVSMR
jgi:hypothetical protein